MFKRKKNSGICDSYNKKCDNLRSGTCGICISDEANAPVSKLCKLCCDRVSWCNTLKKNSISKIIIEDRIYGSLLRQLFHNNPKYIINGKIGGPHGDERYHTESNVACSACSRCGAIVKWYTIRMVQYGAFEYHNHSYCKLCLDAEWPKWKIRLYQLFGKVKYFGPRKKGAAYTGEVRDYAREIGLICFVEHLEGN